MASQNAGVYLVPTEQPPDPVAISRFIRHSHFADKEARLRPPTTAPLVFPALARYCISNSNRRGQSPGSSSSKRPRTDGNRRSALSPRSFSHDGESQEGLSQMELFGGIVNTDSFLTPASEKLSRISGVLPRDGNSSSSSQDHSNLDGRSRHEHPRNSSSQPVQTQMLSAQMEDSRRLSSPRLQYVHQSLPQPMQPVPPVQHTRPSPWNQGGATLTPTLTSLMDTPPQTAPRSAPRKRAAANSDPNGPPERSHARRGDQSVAANEQLPLPPRQGGPAPKRQAARTSSSPPRSTALPHSSSSSSSSSTSGGGLLSRPSFAAPRSAHGGYYTALPRNFFRGLQDSSSPGSDDAIFNGALDPDLLRKFFTGRMCSSDASGLASTEQCADSCIFHVGLVWRDAELSTNFTPTAVKHCTPSQDCTKWFCSCKRAIRASVAFAPLLGCLVHVQTPTAAPRSSQAPEEPSPLTVFLPLMPCEGDTPDVGSKSRGSDEANYDGGVSQGDSSRSIPWVAPYAAFADSAPLPLPSQSSLRERWSLFRDLLCRHTVVRSFSNKAGIFYIFI